MKVPKPRNRQPTFVALAFRSSIAPGMTTSSGCSQVGAGWRRRGLKHPSGTQRAWQHTTRPESASFGNWASAGFLSRTPVETGARAGSPQLVVYTLLPFPLMQTPSLLCYTRSRLFEIGCVQSMEHLHAKMILALSLTSVLWPPYNRA
jgi:hypothetical protein